MKFWNIFTGFRQGCCSRVISSFWWPFLFVTALKVSSGHPVESTQFLKMSLNLLLTGRIFLNSYWLTVGCALLSRSLKA